MKNSVLALDLGGTSLKCALVTDGVLTDKRRVPTDVSRGAEGIADTYRKGLSFYRGADYCGVAVSSAGKIGADGKVLFATPLLPGYMGFDLGGFISRETGKICECLNDGQAAAFCEYVARGAEGRAAMLTLGTGVGGAWVCGGEISDFAEQGAGHVCLEKGGRVCSCGRQGCIEQYISGTALNAALGDMPHAEIWQKYLGGDERVCAAVETWKANIKKACALLYSIKPFDVIVLGGGLSEAGKFWFDETYFSSEEYRIELSRRGNDAGMLGAYEYFRKKHM